MALSRICLSALFLSSAVQRKTTASGADFLAINPKGYVPALLLDDGSLLTEVPAILQYLADRVPDKRLAPPNGSLERYRLQGWLGFIGTELHKSCSPFFNPAAGDDWKRVARANLEKRLAHLDAELEGREWLAGTDFGIADAYLFTVLRWMTPIGLDLSRWPRLLAHRDRVAARPAVQAALRAEGIG